MKPFGFWTIEVWTYDRTAKTGRWVTWRHRDGEKNCARFTVFGKLKRFVKAHAINLGAHDQKVRAYNQETHEYRNVVIA